MNHKDYDAYQAMQDQSESDLMRAFMRSCRANNKPPPFPWSLIIVGCLVTIGVLVMFKVVVG